MHAVKKERRLENEKFFEIESWGYRDGIKKRDKIGMGLKYRDYIINL